MTGSTYLYIGGPLDGQRLPQPDYGRCPSCEHYQRTTPCTDDQTMGWRRSNGELQWKRCGCEDAWHRLQHEDRERRRGYAPYNAAHGAPRTSWQKRSARARGEVIWESMVYLHQSLLARE